MRVVRASFLLAAGLAVWSSAACLASAADLAAGADGAAPSGLYLGAYGGAGTGRSLLLNIEDDDNGIDARLKGGEIGVRVGYDQDFGALRAGVLGELGASSLSGSGTDFILVEIEGTFKVRALASLDAKLAYDFDHGSLYTLFGVSAALVDHELLDQEFSALHVGWNAGVGFETEVVGDLSFFTEYRRYQFQSNSYFSDIIRDHTVDQTANVVVAGMNLHF